jgi:acyl-CoA synthetase (AMP-forming)/AMP-acid ligase II
VVFAVGDGQAGFPARLVDEAPAGKVELKVEDGSLRVRSPGLAFGYLGAEGGPIAGSDGFADTGDMVERQGDRYHFVGRRGGIINVGGLKVHPEEVEAVINRHPGVRMALVRPRRNPITGAVVVAEIVPATPPEGPEGEAALREEVLAACRAALAAHKVPAAIRVVPALTVAASGKLQRGHA